MITTRASIALGLAFVLLGGLNIWLVLESWSRAKSSVVSRRMLMFHRIGGYAFIAVFCVMTYFMLARLSTRDTDGSSATTIHLALAMILSPLLFIKVLIARYYKNQHGLLIPIGLAIFVAAFALISSTVGPYLLRPSRIVRVSTDSAHVLPASIDLNQASELMQKRCSKCHTLDRVVGARKDADGWLATVNRMRGMPSAEISEPEARTIISYLISQNRPQGSAEQAKLAVGRALVDQRCGRCHPLDRVYKTVQPAADWQDTVDEMAAFAAGSAGAISPDEQRQILEYLSATQTPASDRKAATVAGAAPVQNLPTGDLTTPAAGSRFNRRDAVFISLVCLAAGALAIRRRGPRAVAPVEPAAEPGGELSVVPPGALTANNGPMVLRLIKSTEQTADSKTLRFALPADRKLDALPGQFLAFSFLFDGKKETRCYSICSSPARSGYVEITPKRMKGGCVSVFLNERASIGMTVEAAGPFGQFCPDFSRDSKIVLIAAGSGITPMMAMLRYIEDLCLDVECTLLYCVRTTRDIIFRDELIDLSSRLAHFRYDVLLSEPDSQWTGPRGRINAGFIRSGVPDTADRVFFLCGPPPFMEVARAILVDLGVQPDRIRQEVFGGAGANSPLPGSISQPTGFQVVFARSGKTVGILAGQSLLEAAASAGVAIPSACRQGQCGTCKTKLLAGSVRMTAENGLDPESKDRGFILTCVGHADGDIRLDA